MKKPTERTDLRQPGRADSSTPDIEAQLVGTKDPTLIFVHGFGCSLEDWNYQVNALSSRFRCVALDLPGHGRSARPETASIGVMASAVNSVRERFGAKNAILIGHSMGCRVIAEAFRQSRSNVVGLIFVDGSMLAGDPETAVSRARSAMDTAGVDAFTQRMFNEMFLESSNPELQEHIVARALSLDAKFRQELMLNLVGYDTTQVAQALETIDVPVLVLQATHINSEFKRMPIQPGMTTPWMDAVARAVPKSQVKIIEGSGHFTMLEAAQLINDAIAQFAARQT